MDPVQETRRPRNRRQNRGMPLSGKVESDGIAR
jgi:hypothetical protein